MCMKKYIILILSLSLIGGIGYLTYKQTNVSYKDYINFGVSIPKNTTILGLDISHHQGKIDWKKVSKMRINTDSIQFAYLKVTEGRFFKDNKYLRNRKQLDQLPIKVGVYHFFSPGADVVKQVKHFTKNFKKTTLKPALDVETIGKLSKSELIKAVHLFLTETEKQIGVRPIIYTYSSFYKDYFKGTSLAKETFWIANYNRNCPICETKNVVAWQFTEKGTIDGINTLVDLNSAKANFWKNVMWH